VAELQVSEHFRVKYGEFADDMAALCSEDAETVMAAVTRLVAAAPSVLPALEEARSAKYVALRLNAVRVLAGIGTEDAKAILVRIAEEDRNNQVRALARDALGGLSSQTGQVGGPLPEQSPTREPASDMDAGFESVRKKALKKLEETENPMMRLESVFARITNDTQAHSSAGGDGK